jgi:predicted permease
MNRLWNLLRRRSLDARLEEEAQSHLEMMKADLVRQGRSPAEAEREARRQFGSLAAVREAHRDERGVPWLEDFARDARYALRSMASAPLFTAIAVLTLALGIGPNTAIFSLVNAALLRSQPYDDPASLVEPTKMRLGQIGWPVVDSRTFLHLRDNARSLEHVAAARDRGTINLIQGENVRPSTTMKVSDNYFAAKRTLPSLGRNFSRAEDSPGAAPVTILGHSVFQQAFRGDPAILNQTVNLGGRYYTVIGVLPASHPEKTIDFYTPMQARPVGDGDNIQVFARLRPGVTPEQANAELTNLWRDLLRQYSREPNKAGDFSMAVMPYGSSDGRGIRTPLLMIFGVVGLVLLIACANLANLLLARAAARMREISLRATLGAGRGRLFRQLVTESVMLSLAGGLLGLALGYGLMQLLIKTSPFGLDDFDVQLDRAVLLFTLAASVVTGLLFGIIPAWHGTRLDLAEATKQSGGAKASAGRSSARVRWALVFAEVALSAILLVGAGLLVQSFRNLSRVPSGADETNVIAGQMSLQGGKYATASASELFFRRGLERIAANPRVDSAAVTLAMPLERGMNTAVLTPGGVAPDQRKFSNWRYITPTYFHVIRTPILQGRAFSDADGAKAAPVCIISRRFAEQYFKGVQPLGQIVDNGFEVKRTVVGVVADLQNNNLRAPAPPTVYVPIAQTSDETVKMAHTWFPVSWVVRGRDASGGLTEVVTREIKAVDPLQPFGAFLTIEQIRGQALRMDRFLAFLLAGFAMLAAILAAAGIYGVISYGVTQRTHEIGIRLALGASANSVILSVLRNGAVMAGAGALAGVAGAYALSKFLAGYVFGVQPHDPWTMVATALFLLVVAMLASLLPALRVGRLDPARALRVD